MPMLSQDLFTKLFDAETAKMAAWSQTLRDCAEVETERQRDYWRIRLRPHSPRACPVELIVHRSEQTYDLQIGTHSIEGRPIAAITDFSAILAGVADGLVVQRDHHAAVSHRLCLREMVVTAPDGRRWQHDHAVATPPQGSPMLIREQHWVAYRRSQTNLGLA